MKKQYLVLVLAVLLFPLYTFAQVEVFDNGHVEMAGSSPDSVKVKVGSNGFFLFRIPWARTGLYTVNSSINTLFNIGTLSESFTASGGLTSSYKAIGVMGFGGGASSGNNYGVIGITANNMGGTTYGAGIYGTANHWAETLSDNYAGYFDGATHIDGTLTATQFNNPSDIRLKENVSDLCADGESALASVMSLNALKYNYKKREREGAFFFDSEESRAQVEANDLAESKVLHFGLSAQELQAIYPNLVKEDSDGYLSVNYVELVPVLIQCIKELKQQLDTLTNGNAP